MKTTKKKESEVKRHLQVRLSQRVYAAVDRARGPLTRQKWVTAILEKAVGL